MKALKIIPFIVLLFFTSCYSFQQIGEVNMISHRNIDASHNYVLLVSYVGGTDNERKNSKAETIEEAIDNTVQKVPGGEYLMNVKIYEVIKGGGGKGKTWFAVEGDVWGEKQDGAKTITSKSSYSFNKGDHVTWKHAGEWYTGVIIALKDMNSCVVKFDNGGDLTDLNYTDLSKIDSQTIQQTAPKTDFQMNDHVTWKHDGQWYTGVIIALKDMNSCVVKFDNDGTLTELNFSDLTKTANK